MFFLIIVTIVSFALLLGTEFAVWAFVNPVLWRLDDAAQAAAIALFARRLGTVMPFWYGGSLVLLASAWAIERHGPHALLLLSAICIWAAVILLSLLFLVPINNRMARLDTRSFVEESRREHRKWDAMHRVRVIALISAFACVVAACIQK